MSNKDSPGRMRRKARRAEERGAKEPPPPAMLAIANADEETTKVEAEIKTIEEVPERPDKEEKLPLGTAAGKLTDEIAEQQVASVSFPNQDTATKQCTDGKTEPEKHDNLKDRKWIGSAIFAFVVSVGALVANLEGQWHEWWVECLLVPALLIALSITLYEFLRHKLKICMLWSGIWGGASLFVFGGITLWMYVFLDRGWQPPQVPKGVDSVSVSLGPFISTYRVSDLVNKRMPFEPLFTLT